MLTLYTHPQSRGAIVRWMLEELGVAYDQQCMAYGPEMKTPAYLAVNPMGKVPAICHETASGRVVVTETAAICAYLADAFPEVGLAPALPQRAAYYRWLFFAAGPLEMAITDQARKLTLSAEQQAMFGYNTFEQVLVVLEQAVGGEGWIGGPQFSAADVYVGAQIDFGMQFGLLPVTPVFEAYVARLRERPAYQKARAIDAALLAEAAPKTV